MCARDRRGGIKSESESESESESGRIIIRRKEIFIIIY
jgi:hypothetical protein